MKKLIQQVACACFIFLSVPALANYTGPIWQCDASPNPAQSVDIALGIDPTREPWYASILSEAASLSSGNFSDQDRLAIFAQHTNRYPLVSEIAVPGVPQDLFAAYLLDIIPGGRALGFLSRATESGKDSIEDLFKTQINSPLNFDAIFSNFLTYTLQAAGNDQKIPLSQSQSGGGGISVPSFAPIATIHSLPASLQASLVPYSFAILQLDNELPANAVVNVSVMSAPSCEEGFAVLWKPAGPKTLAVYSTGCAQQSPQDNIVFHLTITD